MSVHLIFEFLTAFVGTIAFALLFQVPKEYYVNCGLAGGCGWICYKLLLAGCGLFGSTFFATVLVVFLSRLSAVRRHCPVTIFLVAGIFPLVPGAGIYWTAYYVVTDQLAKASDRGFQTLKIAVAIVLGILFVFEFLAGRSAVRLPATDPHTGLFQLQSPTTNTESRYIQQCSTHLM